MVVRMSRKYNSRQRTSIQYLPTIVATTNAEDSSEAWFVYLGRGFVDHDSKTHTGHAWCVRGVMNAEAY